MVDLLGPDLTNLSQEYLDAAISNSGSILQQMIGTSMAGNAETSAYPSTLLMTNQQGLNLREDAMMVQAMGDSLNQPGIKLEKESIERAKFMSVMGQRKRYFLVRAS